MNEDDESFGWREWVNPVMIIDVTLVAFKKKYFSYLDEDAKKYFDRIERSITKMKNLIEKQKKMKGLKEEPTHPKYLVADAIEDTLSNINPGYLENLSYHLLFDYNCQISDCYENPEYLKRLLKELFGNSAQLIIDSIDNRVRELSDDKQVNEFLKIINR